MSNKLTLTWNTTRAKIDAALFCRGNILMEEENSYLNSREKAASFESWSLSTYPQNPSSKTWGKWTPKWTPAVQDLDWIRIQNLDSETPTNHASFVPSRNDVRLLPAHTPPALPQVGPASRTRVWCLDLGCCCPRTGSEHVTQAINTYLQPAGGWRGCWSSAGLSPPVLLCLSSASHLEM